MTSYLDSASSSAMSYFISFCSAFEVCFDLCFFEGLLSVAVGWEVTIELVTMSGRGAGTTSVF